MSVRLGFLWLYCPRSSFVFCRVRMSSPGPSLMYFCQRWCLNLTNEPSQLMTLFLEHLLSPCCAFRRNAHPYCFQLSHVPSRVLMMVVVALMTIGLSSSLERFCL
jgi:hypothetical protein